MSDTSDEQVYLDYQSAKPVDARVLEQMTPYFSEKFGNPSSLHHVGDVATEALEQSRKKVAEFIGAKMDEIVFTSGATESINLGIIGYALRNKRKGKHIVISEVEHISIRNIAKYLEREGFLVSRIPVDQYGQVKLGKLESRLRDDTILVSIQYANNEIGTIQRIQEIGEVVHDHGAALHTDAVAAEGLVPINVEADNIDLMSISSNDIYGPKGAGLLFMRRGHRVNPLMIGGGQERGLRSGSEDVASIVGMATAAEIMQREMHKEVKRFKKYRDRVIDSVLNEVPDSYLNGHPEERLANNAHFRFDGIEGESILLSFKDLGIAISTGSACTSKTLEPSHCLIATGLLHEEAHGSLEITVGRYNTDSDIDKVIDAVPKVVSRLRELSPIYTPKEKVMSR